MNHHCRVECRQDVGNLGETPLLEGAPAAAMGDPEGSEGDSAAAMGGAQARERGEQGLVVE